MDDVELGKKADTDRVDPAHSEASSQPSHLFALGIADRVEGVERAGSSSDLGDEALISIRGDDVHFPATHFDIAIDDREPMVDEEFTGKSFAELPDRKSSG
jgi:hypothetical protein